MVTSMSTDVASPVSVEPLEVLLPWTARGASLVLSAIRGDDRRARAPGWYRRQVSSGGATRHQAVVPDVLRLAFAGVHEHWARSGLHVSTGLTPLRSALDLLFWSEHPLSAWPINLGDCPYDRDESIIDRETAELTDFGEELARASDRRLDSQLADELVFDFLRKTSRENPETDAYRMFRHFLIEHPVLTEAEFRSFRGVLPTRLVEPARTLLELAYRPWPVSDRDVRVTVCTRCRNPIANGAQTHLRCATPWCAAVDGGTPVELTVPLGTEWYEQRRGVRLYIGLPGLAEVDLERQLACLDGVRVDLWPGPPSSPDAYDLAVHFVDETTWALDVKDHQRPFRLGDTTDIPTVFGTETRRLLVVPAWRMKRPDYANRARALVKGSSVELIDTDQLVRQARTAAARLRSVVQ